MTSMQHKPLRLPANREKLLARAFAADDGYIAVGGLASKLGLLSDRPQQQEHQTSLPRPNVSGAGLASLARLVQFSRLEQSLTPEVFAEKLGLELKELVDIEQGTGVPELRALYQIGAGLGVSYEKLQMLVGYRIARDESLEGQRLKFAASSGPMDKLTKTQSQALHDFIRALHD